MSTLCIIIRVNGSDPRSCPTSPAEWNVLPLVGSARSSTTTSVVPSWARCQAIARAADACTDHDDLGAIAHHEPSGVAAASSQSR